MHDEPDTDKLLDDLLATPSIDRFVAGMPDEPRALDEYLNELLQIKGMKRSEVIRRSGLNETFAYQLFTGTRNASRDKVLQLGFGFPLIRKEMDRLLQAAGHNGLYPKDRRDAILIYCIEHGFGRQRTDDELYRLGETTLGLL